jgi:hypothetical protein
MLLQRSLALRLRLNKLDNCGFLAAITLRDALIKKGKNAKIVQGYIKVKYDVAWHVWVESEGEVMDIGMTLASLVDKEFEKIKPEYLLTEPTDGHVDKNEKIVEDFELFQKDSKKFWESVDRKFKSFHSKFLSNC